MDAPVPNGLLEDVERVLRAADAELALASPVCVNRGLCCHFGKFGHQLRVTSAELALFAARQSALGPLRPVTAERRCPYQVDGQCAARAHRPLGCRMFFCDQRSQTAQQDAYERAHAQLAALHAQHGLPYRYQEWLTALAGLAAQSQGEAAAAPPASA